MHVASYLASFKDVPFVIQNIGTFGLLNCQYHAQISCLATHCIPSGNLNVSRLNILNYFNLVFIFIYMYIIFLFDFFLRRETLRM